MGGADFVVTVNGNLQYVINGVVNAPLTLTRGQTYLFDLSAFNDEHPFVINAQANNPFAPLLVGPASGQVISFTPNTVMPATIYYHCVVHYTSMTGSISLGPPAPACPGDLNNDQAVNSSDFGIFVGAFGSTCSGCPADMNGNGVVNSSDFGLFVGAFGNSCGP